jgi:hypothetical protein
MLLRITQTNPYNFITLTKIRDLDKQTYMKQKKKVSKSLHAYLTALITEHLHNPH